MLKEIPVKVKPLSWRLSRGFIKYKSLKRALIFNALFFSILILILIMFIFMVTILGYKYSDNRIANTLLGEGEFSSRVIDFPVME